MATYQRLSTLLRALKNPKFRYPGSVMSLNSFEPRKQGIQTFSTLRKLLGRDWMGLEGCVKSSVGCGVAWKGVEGCVESSSRCGAPWKGVEGCVTCLEGCVKSSVGCDAPWKCLERCVRDLEECVKSSVGWRWEFKTKSHSCHQKCKPSRAVQRRGLARFRKGLEGCSVAWKGSEGSRKALYNGSVRNFHSSLRSCQKDVPDYLIGSVNEITLESDLLHDLEEEEEEEEKNMEDDIIDFLNPRLITFEETDSSFIIPCPVCSRKDEDEPKLQEIFIDKNSGYFVCPWCCRDGPWEDLRELLNSREDTLTIPHLVGFMSTTAQLNEGHSHLLNETVFQTIGVETLKEFGARINMEETRLVLPLQDVSGDVIGFESVSLLHHEPQVIRRFVTGRSEVFCPPLGSASEGKRKQNHGLIIVPSCCDVVSLYKLGYHSISLPQDDVAALERYILQCEPKDVTVWNHILPPPRHILHTLIRLGITSAVVESKESSSSFYLKTEREIQTALKHRVPLVSKTITTFIQLRDKVFYRLTHKEETCGVQWQRFKALNDLLLGHRPAELTVLTGPTGSGKTTLMAEYSLDLCTQGVCTLWGSFEVSLVRLCEVMLQQYHGSPLPQEQDTFNTIASGFSSLPLHFLTYHGQESVENVVKAMREAVSVWGVQHVVIDNLQFMIGMPEEGGNGDRWREQDRTVAMLRKFATETQCHVTIIAHPKKVPEGQPLSIASVFGSAKITQEADNVLILQVKEPNMRKTLQVVKNRYGGQLGHMNLTFHKDSLTLSQFFKVKGTSKVKQDQVGSGEVKRKLQVRGLAGFET